MVTYIFPQNGQKGTKPLFEEPLIHREKDKGVKKMAVIDELKVIDGYFDGDIFIMRGIAGFAIDGKYKADGLSSMARLIDDTPMSFTIDKERVVHIPVEKNKEIKKELLLIANELENL